MALPLPKYGLNKLYLFPYYQSRDEYQKATGAEPPPYDPTKDPKHWFDPAAAQSAKKYFIYDRILAIDNDGMGRHGPDGKPFFEELVLSRQEAATLNIPHGYANEANNGKPPIPCPVRPLDDDEELAFEWADIVVVHNKKLWGDLTISWSPQDRELLRAIAKKLGVPVLDALTEPRP
jgi:hypothetical protein